MRTQIGVVEERLQGLTRTFVRRVVASFRALVPFPSEGGTAPATVPGIAWSDHWSFAQVGIPAVMITDTAFYRNRNYHRASDTPDTLDYRRMAMVVQGLDAAVRRLAR